MKTSITMIYRIGIYAFLFFVLVSIGKSQQVYQNNFQATYNLGRYEINYTLIQRNPDSYYCLPSQGGQPLGQSNYYLEILETDGNFQPLWAGQFVLESSVMDSVHTMIAYDLIQSRDSCLYACGQVTLGDYPYVKKGFILKLSFGGSQSWIKFYDPVKELRSIIQTSDDNFASCGYLNQWSDSTRIGTIIKIDPSGNVQWDREYWVNGDTIPGNSEFNQLIRSNDTIFAIGSINNGYPNQAESDIMLVKLRNNGSMIRQVAYTRISDTITNSSVEMGKTLRFKNNRLWLSGFLVNGDTNLYNNDYYVMEVNKDYLNPLWAKRYNIFVGNADSYEQIQRFLDDNDTSLTLVGYAFNYLFSGWYNQNAFSVNMNSYGYSPYYDIYGGAADDYFYKPIRNTDGNLMMAGYTGSFNNNDDIYFVEQYSSVLHRCHDTVMPGPFVGIDFKTYKLIGDSVGIHPINVKFEINEIQYVYDTICPKILIDSLPKSGLIPALEFTNSIASVSQEGYLTIPQNATLFSIYNMAGALIQTENATGSLSINVSYLKPGVYVLRLIMNTGEVVNLRFIR